MKELLEKLKKNRLNEDFDRKKSDYKQEKEILKEYNGRQLLELLQNIDDQKSDKALIKLDKKNKTIMIANSGEPFNEGGLKSLMMAHLSSKDKTFIGNKGLGFRSLLNWIGAIYVKSKNLSIEFSRENRNRILKENEKIAILSAPEWIDENNQRSWINTLDFEDEYITYVAVNYKKEVEDAIIDQLNEITKELLFFINHIKQIKIEIIGEETKIFNKNQWEIKEKDGILPPEVIDEDADEDEKEYYQLKVIIPPKGTKEVDTRLFSYFPTNIKIDFPVLVHATFDLDSSRNTIIDSKKNRYIVKELAKFLVEIGQRLKCNKENCKLKTCSLEKCPHYNEGITNWCAFKYFDLSNKHKNEILDKYGFYNIFKELKEKIAIYPTIDNKYKNIKYTSFYTDGFSDYMIKYKDIFQSLLKKGDDFSIKRNDTISKNYIPKIQNLLNQVSKRIKSINERIIFINHIENLIKISPISFEDGEKLDIFVNQNNISVQKMFWYNEVFEKLDISNILEIDYLHKDIFENISPKWKNCGFFIEFDMEKDFYEKIINSDKSFQEKLSILHKVFIANIEKPKIKINGITGKYIRHPYLLKLYPKEMIIKNYDYLGINKFDKLEEFLIWLNARPFDLRSISKEIKLRNDGNKKELKWSLNALMILKDELKDKINLYEIKGLNLNEDVKLISTLFEYHEGLERENIIANKETLGLDNYTEEEITKFYKVLHIKEFNYRTNTLEKLDLLKKHDLSFEKYSEIFKILINLYKHSTLENNPNNNNNIYIFGKKLNNLYINNKYTTKYFKKEVLILDEIEKCKLNYYDYLDFYKWLGIKEASINEIIDEIFNSNIDDQEKLADLFEIYIKTPNLPRITSNYDLKVFTKNGKLKSIKNLYLNNEISKYCDPSNVMKEVATDEKKNFYKWLNAGEPSAIILKNRYIELLTLDNINMISLDERREIIKLLYNLYESSNFEKIDKELYLITRLGEIKKNTFLYKKDELSEKYANNYIIDFDNSLNMEFLNVLGIKNICPFQILENLLSNEHIDFKECFEIKKKYAIKKELSANIKENILIKNKNGNLKKSKNLFLEKEITSFYSDDEKVAEYKDLNLSDFNIKEIEKFLIWLGVNEYIKYEIIDNRERVYALNRIKNLPFKNLVELIEKENILNNKGVLTYLRNSHPQYKYWILNYGDIEIIKPTVKYENNEAKIKILKDFGIKENFDSVNASELLTKLHEIQDGENYAPQIYKRLYDEKINIEGKYQICINLDKSKENIENFKYDNSEVCYLQDYRTPKDIRKNYKFINLPINLDIEKVERLFNLKKFPYYKYKIENFQEILGADEFKKDLDMLKPYFLAIIVGDKKELEDKKKMSEKIKNLNIKFGTFEAYANDKKIKLDTYEMISEKSIYYIFAEKYDKNNYNNLTLLESIDNIFSTEFSEYPTKIDLLTSLFENRNFDSVRNKLEKTCGSNIIEQMKYLLNPKEEMLEESTYFDYEEESIEDDINDIVYDDIIEEEKIENSRNMSIDNMEKVNISEKTYADNGYPEFINKNYNNLDNIPENKKMGSYSRPSSNYDINSSYKRGYTENTNNNYEDTQEAGRQAEEIIKKLFPHFNQVSGYSEYGSDHYGYDFTYIGENGLENYVEVKNFSNKHFYVTENELERAIAYQERYHFYLVDKFEILNIGNPFKKENIRIKIK